MADGWSVTGLAGAGPANAAAGVRGARVAAGRLRRWLTHPHEALTSPPVLMTAVAVMAVGIAARLPVELFRFALALPADGGGLAARDLALRWVEVRAWLSGAPVYGALEHADYPPASHLMMAPVAAWESFAVVRTLWLAAMLASLAALGWAFARRAGARTRLEAACLAVLPAATYAVAASARLGQSAIVLSALILGGILLLAAPGRSWWRLSAGCGLVLLSLVKPTYSAPFAWIAIALAGWRAAVLIGGGYAVLTVWAAWFQPVGLTELVSGWLAQSGNIPVERFYANLFTWLAQAGLEAWMLPSALAVLVATGAWVARHRSADVWLLLGVVGLVARFWATHRHYDDLLVLFAAVALFRAVIDAAAPAAERRAAAVLLALLVGIALMPASLLLWPDPVYGLLRGTITAAWLAALAALLVRAERQRRGRLAEAGA